MSANPIKLDAFRPQPQKATEPVEGIPAKPMRTLPTPPAPDPRALARFVGGELASDEGGEHIERATTRRRPEMVKGTRERVMVYLPKATAIELRRRCASELRSQSDAVTAIVEAWLAERVEAPSPYPHSDE